MPKSNRGGSFGRRSGTVTVIEEPVRRSSIRTAKIVFHVLWPSSACCPPPCWPANGIPSWPCSPGIGIGLVAAAHRRRPGDRSGPCCAPCGGGPPKSASPWAWSPAGWTWPTTPPCRTGIGVVVILTGVPAAIPPVRRRDHRGLLVPDHPAPYPGLLQPNSSSPTAPAACRSSCGPSPPASGNASGSACAPAWPWPTSRTALDLIAVACWADTAIAESASGVQLRARAAGHQTPRRPHRTGHHPAARADHARHPTPGPGRPAGPHRAGPARRHRRRRHPPGQASHPHPRGQETTRARPGPGPADPDVADWL